MAEQEKETQEVEAKETESNYEIVDDTPEEDKNVEPYEGDAEPTPDELDKYSGKVKNRIEKLTKRYHDERRIKEKKEKEAREAFNYAKSLQEENKKLRENLSKGEDTLLKEARARAEAEHQAALNAYKKAYEDGNAENMADAQAKIAEATVAKNKWKEYTPQYKQAENNEKTLQNDQNKVYNSNTEVPAPDEKATAWFNKNPWFGENKVMTAGAYAIHQDLVESGVDPRTDKYYEAIDTRLRQEFPSYFDKGSEEIDDTTEEVTEESATTEEPATTKGRTPNVVAPVKRAPSSKKIRLTQTQVSIAKRLGVPLEEYAKQVAQLNN